MSHGKNVRVDAVEYSSVAVKKFKERVRGEQRIKVIRADMFDYLRKSPPSRYDALYANAVFHFLSTEERRKLYQLAYEALRPNGILAISFKAYGDILQARGKKIKDTSSGVTIRGNDGITRLFVRKIAPIIKELERGGFHFRKSYKWAVRGYNLPHKDSRFVGLIAIKRLSL